MPTYVLHSISNQLNATQKADIVDKVTQIHHEETGAPAYLVGVIFSEVIPGNWFINRRPVPREQIWIRADIRSGRTDAQKTRLCHRLTMECAEVAGIDASYWRVYICNTDKTSGFGSVLPKPGEEEEWVATLDKDVRDRYGLYKL